MVQNSYIELLKLAKSFGNLEIINNLNLKIEKGEFIGLFGPNGCGKTTLLKIIAGLEKPNKGKILVDSDSPVKKRIGFINQSYTDALMPWLNCLENILFPYTLNNDTKGKEYACKKLKTILSQLEMALPLENYPYQLSGGQQQLVVILRTVLYNPDIILFDEPFSSLDRRTQKNLKEIIKKLWKEENLTILFVSHNMEDILYFTEEIIVFNSKEIKRTKYLEGDEK